MKLKLRSIISAGDLSRERLTLRAIDDLDVGDYLVAQSGYVNDGPTTSFFHTFWFPYKQIKKNDLVVIYTKRGKERSRKLDGGNTAHFFYLDSDTPIWGASNTGALVFFAPTWRSKPADELRNR